MNKKSKALPPEQGPNPQGMKNGDEVSVKGVSLTSSGDVSYKKNIKQNKIKATYNVKDKELKNLYVKLNIGNGKLNLNKNKYGNTADYSKKLLGGNLDVGVYKGTGKNKEKGFNVKFVKKFQIGALSDLGCPHRESGVRTSIKGIKPIQVKGKKFIGVK